MENCITCKGMGSKLDEEPCASCDISCKNWQPNNPVAPAEIEKLITTTNKVYGELYPAEKIDWQPGAMTADEALSVAGKHFPSNTVETEHRKGSTGYEACFLWVYGSEPRMGIGKTWELALDDLVNKSQKF